MSRTEIFRNQHAEISRLASEISTHLDIDEVSNSPNNVRHLIARLLGHLSVHLVMEDKSLYPSLLEHSNERIKSMARRFMNELGDISRSLDEYKDRWKSILEVREDPHAFVQQTAALLDALTKRIEKENSELYEAVDQLSA